MPVTHILLCPQSISVLCPHTHGQGSSQPVSIPGAPSERTGCPWDSTEPCRARTASRDPRTPHPPPSALSPTHLEDILRGHGGGIRLAHDALVGAGGGRLVPGPAEPQQRALHARPPGSAPRPPRPLRRPAGDTATDGGPRRGGESRAGRESRRGPSRRGGHRLPPQLRARPEGAQRLCPPGAIA